MLKIALSKYLKRSGHFTFYTAKFLPSPGLLWTKNVITCKTPLALNLDNFKPAFQAVFLFFSAKQKRETYVKTTSVRPTIFAFLAVTQQ
jgi:hypothetical protein